MACKRSVVAILAALALGACVYVPNDTKPRGIEHASQTDSRRGGPCTNGARVYRPTQGSKAPYDAVIPPTYDAPSRVPSSCKDLSKE